MAKKNNIHKMTEGCVLQVFSEEGKLLSQEFVAGDMCEYEDDDGILEDHHPGNDFYYPFDMVQPKKRKKTKKKPKKKKTKKN